MQFWVLIGLAIKVFVSYDTMLYKYQWLLYTKTVDRVESALWFATQTPNILC